MNKYPVYKKNDFMVVKFFDKNICSVEFIFDEDKAIEYFNTYDLGDVYDCYHYNEDVNDKQWQDVLYNEEKELWDGQPYLFGITIGI